MVDGHRELRMESNQEQNEKQCYTSTQLMESTCAIALGKNEQSNEERLPNIGLNTPFARRFGDDRRDSSTIMCQST